MTGVQLSLEDALESATMELFEVWVASTKQGVTPAAISGNIGDGVALIDRCDGNVGGLLTTDNARAGFLADFSMGTVRNSQATGNRYGFCLQGAFKPELEADVVATNNSAANYLDDGELVPPPAPGL